MKRNQQRVYLFTTNDSAAICAGKKCDCYGCSYASRSIKPADKENP